MARKMIRTERIGIRLTSAEKDLLDRAGEVLGESDTAELVRASSLLMANTILQLKAGEIALSSAVNNYVKLLLRFSPVPLRVHHVEMVEKREAEDTTPELWITHIAPGEVETGSEDGA